MAMANFDEIMANEIDQGFRHRFPGRDSADSGGSASRAAAVVESPGYPGPIGE